MDDEQFYNFDSEVINEVVNYSAQCEQEEEYKKMSGELDRVWHELGNQLTEEQQYLLMQFDDLHCNIAVFRENYVCLRLMRARSRVLRFMGL